MPSFFDFQLGSDSRALPPPETESLRYGRFRALPIPKRSVGDIFSAFGLNVQDSQQTPRWVGRGPGGAGGGYSYGSININTRVNAAEVEDEEEDEADERWWLDRMLISPRRRMVVKLVDLWWRRLLLLVVLPAAIVSAIISCLFELHLPKVKANLLLSRSLRGARYPSQHTQSQRTIPRSCQYGLLHTTLTVPLPLMKTQVLPQWLQSLLCSWMLLRMFSTYLFSVI